MMKLKKRYKNFKGTSVHYLVSFGKLEILDNMSASLKDVVHNPQYIQMYYPLYDAICNKCYLTLVAPEHVSDFSKLLKIATKSITKQNKLSGTVIPAKEGVVREMIVMMDKSGYDNCIINICETTKSRVQHPNIAGTVRITLIWESVEHILNTKTG